MTDPADTITPSRIAPALVFGLGTTAVMWVIGFLTHLPGIETPPALVGVLMLLAMLVGTTLCARIVSPHAPVRTALTASLVGAFANLLILGSLLVEDDGSTHPDVAIIVLGWFALCAIVGVVGGLVGSHLPRKQDAPARTARDWASALAIVCVAAAAPVLFSGGLVTSNNAGLAVPDWPTSFNANMFMYPLSKMTGGIYYEHAHRLFGSLVGVVTLTFAISAFLWKWPTRVRVMGVIAFTLVLAQGIVGGLRVDGASDDAGAKATTVAQVDPGAIASDYAATTDNAMSIFGAIFHGVFGQLTLAALCVTAAVALRRYAKSNTDIERTVDPIVRYGSMAMMLVLIIQLILGAVTRHLESTHGAWTHAVFAFVVIGLIAVVALRATKHKGTPLPKLGVISVSLGAFQILLGFATLMLVLGTYDDVRDTEPPLTVLTATLHQATGAALLSACTLLHLWALRCTKRDVKPIEHPALV